MGYVSFREGKLLQFVMFFSKTPKKGGSYLENFRNVALQMRL